MPLKESTKITDGWPSEKTKERHGTSGGRQCVGCGYSSLCLPPSVISFFLRCTALSNESGVPLADCNHLWFLNLRTVGASARFVISSDSSHHSSTNFPGAEGDSIVRSAVVPPVMTKAITTTYVATIPSVMVPESGTKAATPVHASMFHDSESTGTTRPDVAGSSHPPVKELSIGSREIHDMDYDELFTEFSVGTARQACFSAKVRMRTEYCLSGKRRLESESEKQAKVARLRTQVSAFEAAEQVHVDKLNTLKQRNVALEDGKESLNGKLFQSSPSRYPVKDRELKDVDANMTSLKSQNDGLADQVRVLEISSSGLQEKVTIYENCMGQLERFQDDRMKIGLPLGSPIARKQVFERMIAAYNPSAEATTFLALPSPSKVVARVATYLDAATGFPYITRRTKLLHWCLLALSLALDVSDIRVRKIRESIANQRYEGYFHVVHVYLKLQPPRQVTIRKDQQQKLSPKYYGHFMILAKVGAISYKLELPNNSQVHPVFHVSQLKLCKGNANKMGILPHCRTDGLLSVKPEAILDRRMTKLNNRAAIYVFVEWANHNKEDATWELYDDLVQRFPDFQMDS
ncbi:membrane-associated progesterone-binding protein 4 [Tanacetum coccineum]